MMHHIRICDVSQLAASFTLRNHVDGFAVEQQFALNSPLLRGIRELYMISIHFIVHMIYDEAAVCLELPADICMQIEVPADICIV